MIPFSTMITAVTVYPDRARITREGTAALEAGLNQLVWLVPRLDRFHERMPDVEVWISADMEVVDFAVDDVDLPIRYGGGRYPGLETDLLMEDQILPVCSPRLLQGHHPLRTPQDLAHHPHFLHDGSPDQEDMGATNWAMWLKAAGVTTVDAKRRAKFNQSSLVIEAAVAGKGVALAKQAIALADLEAGRLVAPFDLTTPSNFSYYLVHPASKSRIAAVKAFKKWLHEEAAAANGATKLAAQ